MGGLCRGLPPPPCCGAHSALVFGCWGARRGRYQPASSGEGEVAKRALGRADNGHVLRPGLGAAPGWPRCRHHGPSALVAGAGPCPAPAPEAGGGAPSTHSAAEGKFNQGS